MRMIILFLHFTVTLWMLFQLVLHIHISYRWNLLDDKKGLACQCQTVLDPPIDFNLDFRIKKTSLNLICAFREYQMTSRVQWSFCWAFHSTIELWGDYPWRTSTQLSKSRRTFCHTFVWCICSTTYFYGRYGLNVQFILCIGNQFRKANVD